MEPEAAQQALDELVAEREKGQPRAASWIGDAIYGVNDGLGAIFGIVSGVSGATLGNSKFVLIAGLAGMFASALSMGSGAYLAAKSEREIYEAEYARERDAVENNEAEARELLSLTFQVTGAVGGGCGPLCGAYCGEQGTAGGGAGAGAAACDGGGVE